MLADPLIRNENRHYTTCAGSGNLADACRPVQQPHSRTFWLTRDFRLGLSRPCAPANVAKRPLNGRRQLPGAVNVEYEASSPPGQLHALLGGGPCKQPKPRPTQRRRGRPAAPNDRRQLPGAVNVEYEASSSPGRLQRVVGRCFHSRRKRRRCSARPPFACNRC